MCISMKDLALFLGSTGHPFVGSDLPPSNTKESLLHEVECLLADHPLLDSNSGYDYGCESTPRLYGMSLVKQVIVIVAVIVEIEVCRWVLS